MPYRRTPLVTNQYYHVYNRGVARQPVFVDDRDRHRFVSTMMYYRFHAPRLRFSLWLELAADARVRWAAQIAKTADGLVAVVTFALMPNHIHVLLRQISPDGISIFMQHLSNSYTKYFNTRHQRVGPLFQGPFKAVHVETDAQLLHVSRYIHLNPLVGHVVDETEWPRYPWSSYSEYCRAESTWLDLQPILSRFPSSAAHEAFVRDYTDQATRLSQLTSVLLEDPH